MDLSKLILSNNLTTDEVADQVRSILVKTGFDITIEDLQRPWGGFFCISDQQINKFIEIYFPNEQITTTNHNLSPKIMLWAPGKRLSWQVHGRRAEIWRIVKGPASAYLSKTDVQPLQPNVFNGGAVINISSGTRHRSGGLDNWAIVAEVWVHTDPTALSDESDIRRIDDDFGRKSI